MLNQLNLIVSDMAAALAFYRHLGLDGPDQQHDSKDGGDGNNTDGDHDGAQDHVELRMANGTSLELDSPASAALWHPDWRPGDNRVVIGLQLPTREAVDQAHDAAVEAGGTSRRRPHDAFWGSRYAIVADPDGNDVGLMSPPDPDHAFAPTTTTIITA
jgi:uncharacterized glyoxalase superfamily protein PhnB